MRFISAAAIVILFCVGPVVASADTTSVKKLILKKFYKELPKGIENLPWSEFRKHLDKYTDILSPEDVREYKKRLEGVSTGRIGIRKRSHPMGWEIIRVVSQSPAYWAGLRAGDVLVGANDTSLTWVDARNLPNIVRGENGSPVLLEYLRNGVCHRTVIPREDIHEDAISCTVLGRTLAIRIEQFGPGLHDSFEKLTGRMNTAMIDTIIFDLRDNPGGRVDETLALLSEFVPVNDTLMTIVYRDETVYELARPFGRWTDTRTMIVLQDDESASASELFAGTLRVRCNAIVVGDTSYGKGRMQSVYYDIPAELMDDASIGGFRFTSALYQAAGTLDVDGIGVIPDMTVDFRELPQAQVPDTFDIVRWRMAVAVPTQQDIDRVNALGFGPVAGMIWGDKAAPYEAYRTFSDVRRRIPAPVWACTADHDSVPTAYTRKEEEAIRRLLAKSYQGELADSILRLEPVERLLEHVNQRATIVKLDKRDEPEDPSRPNSDDLGIALDSIGGVVYVTGVYHGSPAYAAGVCIGDRIVTVNGKPLPTGLDWARRDIRRATKNGGSVRLSLSRGTRAFTLALNARSRDVGTPLTYVDDGIGYIATDRFASSMPATTQVMRAINKLRDSGVGTIVFDVRGSQGGTMEYALRVLELFATKGDTLARLWKNGKVVYTAVAKANGECRRIPVFVCVDAQTVGAAEMLAASMQRNRRAMIVGEPTQGAMTESMLVNLTDRIGMRRVTRQFARMSGARVEPDLMLTLSTVDVAGCQRLAGAGIKIMDYRLAWHEPTADLIDDAIVRLPSHVAVPDRAVMADLLYGGGARLFNLAGVMRRVVVTSPRITKR